MPDDFDDIEDLTDSTRVRRPSIVPDAPAIKARLTIARSPDPAQVGRVYPIRKDDVTVGRDSTNVVALNDPDVSRHHAQIVARDGAHLVVDLNSTNGTHVNGKRVKEAPLRKGDTLLIGSTVLTYELA
jgi:pSer/pThr/pTyr-binding forkhead associated (FHA) protein